MLAKSTNSNTTERIPHTYSFTLGAIAFDLADDQVVTTLRKCDVTDRKYRETSHAHRHRPRPNLPTAAFEPDLAAEMIKKMRAANRICGETAAVIYAVNTLQELLDKDAAVTGVAFPQFERLGVYSRTTFSPKVPEGRQGIWIVPNESLGKTYCEGRISEVLRELDKFGYSVVVDSTALDLGWQINGHPGSLPAKSLGGDIPGIFLIARDAIDYVAHAGEPPWPGPVPTRSIPSELWQCGAGSIASMMYLYPAMEAERWA